MTCMFGSICYCCSVTKSSVFLQPHGLLYTRFLCSLLSSRVYSDSCSLSQWCYLTISSSAICFSFCHQSFLALDLFPKNQLFTSSGQSIGASASASVLLMNIKDWFPSGLTSLVFQSKRLSRVSSHATVQKHQLFGFQPSLWSNSRIYTWLLEKP